MNENLIMPIAVVALLALPFLALWLKRVFFPNRAEAAYQEAKRAASAARNKALQTAEADYNERIKPFTTKYSELCKTGAVTHLATEQLLIISKIAHRDYERDVKYAWHVYKGAIETAKAAYKEAKRAATKGKPPG